MSKLAAIYVLYAPSHRQDSTYYGLCYTSHELNGRKEVNVLFNDTLNTFHLRLYGWICQKASVPIIPTTVARWPSHQPTCW